MNFRALLPSAFQIATLLMLPMGGAVANTWLIEPSVAVDFGYDDNYGMDIVDPKGVGVSKVTGAVSVRSLSEAYYFRGGLLADAVTYHGDDSVDPNSNQVAYFQLGKNFPRSRLGMTFRLRRDSLLREAAANPDQVVDTDPELDASVDQFVDVTRQRFFVAPFVSYNLTRLTDARLEYRLSAVQHDKNENEVTGIADYQNHAVVLRLGHKVTPRDKLFTRLGATMFATDVDEDEAKTEFQTTYLRLGYERLLSPTFTVSGDAGYRVTQFTKQGEADVETDGPVASVSAVKTTGLTLFELRAGIELYPSSIGQVVKTQEVVANIKRNLSELMVFTLRSRLYQNKALSGGDTIFGAQADNNRRSMEIRPAIDWQLSREWKVGAAYRYRREKLDSKPSSAEGNSILFSVKYTRISPVGR